MEQMFDLLLKRCREGKDSVITVIVQDRGSSPRSAGAWMAVGEKGRLLGTIGGGNLEYRAIEEACSMLRRTADECTNSVRESSRVRNYDLSRKETADLGMVCGGRVKVLFYRLDAGNCRTEKFLSDGLTAARSGQPYRIMLPLSGAENTAGVDAGAADETDMSRLPLLEEKNGTEWYTELFAWDKTVYILGGGHLAQETVPLLSHLGFSCVAADDREEFTDPGLFPGAKKVLLVDFSRLEEDISVEEGDYILIVTRGHLCDIEAERFALGTKAGYIGAVGSRRKAKYVRDRLEQEGFSPEQLDRVITPVGIPIGSETPAEIAVSIAAQLIQVRAQKRKSREQGIQTEKGGEKIEQRS